MNTVNLIGRLTKDPELKYTSNRKGNTRFTLAVSRNKDETDFINCVAWEKTAENIAEYFKKGSQIAVQGAMYKFDFVGNNNSSNNQNKKEEDENFPF